MAISSSLLKIKMDGQEHELSNYDINNDMRSIMLDLEDTICVDVDNIQKLFDKELQILRVGCDDDYIKAKIDTLFVDNETKDNRILGLSF